jgi:MATE family multidrug resistance protein
MNKTTALKQLMLFSLPIIFGQIGLMLIGTGDMIIAGRYSRECLAAIGLAVAVANPIQISLLGLQFSIGPLLAQKRGQGENVEKYFWTIIIYSLLVSLFSTILTLLSIKLVPLFNYSPELNRIINEYLLIVSFSSIGLGIYMGIKEFFQSMEKTLAANTIALLGAVLNLGLNYLFVFGALNFPQLEEAGLAWASLGTRLLMAVALMLLTFKFWKLSKKIDFTFMKELAKVGFPISVSMFLEIMAFCLVSLLVGKFTEDQVAANNLALNIASLAFMIPLSISSAVAVKVGHAYGEKNISTIQVFTRVSIMASLFFTALNGLTFYFLPESILGFYTIDKEVLVWGAKILFWIACFQLFDGTQVTLSGILRGLSVTKAPSVVIFIGYWLIGLPLGYLLSFKMGFEAQGFWIGLAISLAIVAGMLSVVLLKKFKDISVK